MMTEDHAESATRHVMNVSDMLFNSMIAVDREVARLKGMRRIGYATLSMVHDLRKHYPDLKWDNCDKEIVHLQRIMIRMSNLIVEMENGD